MWTFPTTLVTTAELIADDLPFTGVSFTDTLMGSGTFTADLDLTHPALPADLRETGTRWMTWPCRDGVPFGAYTWLSGNQSDLSVRSMQLRADRSDTVGFARRPVQDDLPFTGVDAADVVRDLYRHGQSLSTLHTDHTVGPYWWAPFGQFPWFRVADGALGISVTRTKVVNGQEDDGWRRKKQKPISQAVLDLATEMGFEVHPRCGVDPATGALFMRMDLGTPTVGLPAGSAGAIVLEFPSSTVPSAAYGWNATDFRTATALVGGEAQGDSTIGYWEPLDLLTAGYPYARTATSMSTVTDGQQLVAAAEAEYRRVSHVTEAFDVTIGDGQPQLGTYGVGDVVLLRADTGAGVVERPLRITAWSIKVDDTRAGETVTPTLSEVPL